MARAAFVTIKWSNSRTQSNTQVQRSTRCFALLRAGP